MPAIPSTPPVLPSFITDKYDYIQTLGGGAYGTVYKCKVKGTEELVAIKHLCNIFVDRIRARRCLREILLLRHLNGHDNIIKILGVEVGEKQDFADVFVVLELMETDLHAIVKSQQPLTDSHLQYFIYQLCRGLKYIHSAGIIHRDLKTGNLLVNSDCEMKICDFGLARQKGNTGFMTEYVATRWYRAPEVMMTSGDYTAAMDMWSVGCILAEFLGGKPLFKGRTYLDTLNQMIGVLGTPDEETLKRVITTPETSSRILSYIKTLKWCPKIPLSTKFPDANPLAVELLEKLLKWDPAQRPTVDQVLNDPWLKEFHDLADEPVCATVVELPFDNVVESRGSIFGDSEKTQLRAWIREAGSSINQQQTNRLKARHCPGKVATPIGGSREEEWEASVAGSVDQELRESFLTASQ